MFKSTTREKRSVALTRSRTTTKTETTKEVVRRAVAIATDVVEEVAEATTKMIETTTPTIVVETKISLRGHKLPKKVVIKRITTTTAIETIGKGTTTTRTIKKVVKITKVGIEATTEVAKTVEEVELTSMVTGLEEVTTTTKVETEATTITEVIRTEDLVAQEAATEVTGVVKSPTTTPNNNENLEVARLLTC
jgi:hypothetical protein